MPLYIFARFEPRPGNDAEFLRELRLVVEPTRAEPGCIRVNLYEGTRDPHVFFIHSAWVDEAAFEVHAELPHTKHFLEAVERLATQPAQAVRTREIG